MREFIRVMCPPVIVMVPLLLSTDDAGTAQRSAYSTIQTHSLLVSLYAVVTVILPTAVNRLDGPACEIPMAGSAAGGRQLSHRYHDRA
jgi:hypothetical protein